MRIVQINVTCGEGSTGKIAVEISKLLTEQSVANYVFYTSGSSDYPLGIRFGNKYYLKFQALKARVLGNWGFNSKAITRRMIAELDKIKPDIVHLHNLHGHNCHLGMLFGYLKKKRIKVIWTFHDCWAFTAYCPHFTMAKCDQWKTGCLHCPQRKDVTWFFDRSKTMFEWKKAFFSGLDMTIVTPSQWLADLVKESFLKDYPVKVINNGIDLNVFKPTESDFRQKYHLEEKKIVLGVAFGWGERKGYNDCLALANMLGQEYQLVLVGVSKEQIAALPKNVLGIERTNSQKELAEIYSIADVFINTTYEDNYPTVNLEARACGTPVVTYRTGGSPESAGADAIVVRVGDIQRLKAAIEVLGIRKERRNIDLDCLSSMINYQRYVDLYKSYGEIQ